MRRRAALQWAAAALPVQLAGAADVQRSKVLRYAFSVAETGFDPVRIADIYSRSVTAHIFDGLYEYDPLARPYLLRPNVAEGMPQVSADFRTWTISIRPGIHFADDPAFGGRPRELVAQDFVYAWKRYFDPAINSPNYTALQQTGMLGLDELREQALRERTRFDYDREVEGLRAIGRHTLQVRLAEPRPRFVYTIAQGELLGAVAREVVERYGERIMEHPVGTGPFRLAAWRRSSKIVLERNPGYREQRYAAQPGPDDAEGQAIALRLGGRRLPMVDRVEIDIIEEAQPRWLSFLNGQSDLIQNLPPEFAPLAVPGGALAPNLQRQGIRLHRMLNPDRMLFYFNMEDPLVGGYTPERVALRRAICLGSDPQREIVGIRRGQAIPAQSVVAPGTWGYDPAFKSENSDASVARARALLDLYGYIDRNGDGWRDQPDGAPLVLHYATQSDAAGREYEELWRRNMEALGIRIQFDKAQWPEQLKMARAGRLMIWQLGYSATEPDAQSGLALLYGPAAGGQNLARFRHARYDAVYRRMQELPDGAERLALLREAQKIAIAYAPHRYNAHRIVNDLSQPWLTGYRRPAFSQQFWHVVDLEERAGR